MRLGDIASSAMNALGVDMLVRANNIANMNTPEFEAQRVTLTSGPQNQGVLVGSIYHDTTPGALVPGMVMTNEGGREVLRPGYVEGSNTDIAREFVHMISTQRAYEANAAVVRTYDDVSGVLLDMKV
ncbi:flagellar basal body protein [Desulfovibrio sp. OttesenSCG-928-O18]|nr:flagellar basal body protein [Desulfovibrio sp. OttesenSCG-928-O18]